MIVIDTSSLITLSTATILPLVLDEYDVHTTETAIQELEETAAYNDTHGEAAQAVLDKQKGITVHQAGERTFESSRIDPGEGSCALLTRDIDAAFLITDDLRAVPELQAITDSRVTISPILLKALLERDVLNRDEALGRLDRIADERDWLGAPIYRRARRLFEEDSS